MDTSEQTRLASEQDNKLAARIVSTIVEIERDYRLAEGKLSEQFMEALLEAMKASAPEPWEVFQTDWSVVLTCEDWKSVNRIGRGDAWFEVTEIAEEDHTWISAAVRASGTTQLGLVFNFRDGLKFVADGVLKEKKAAVTLQKLGFERDGTGQQLFLPIAVDLKRLAEGFAKGNLEGALVTARASVEDIVAARDDLSGIVGEVRKKAKGS